MNDFIITKLDRDFEIHEVKLEPKLEPKPEFEEQIGTQDQVQEDNHIIAFYSCDYADEFDVEGAWFTTQERFDEHLAEAKKVFDKKEAKKQEFIKNQSEKAKNRSWSLDYDFAVEVGFGTNEAVQYLSYNNYVSCFRVEPSTKEVNSLVVTRNWDRPVVGTICFADESYEYDEDEF